MTVAIIWEFRVRAGCEAEFERIYGPGGDWARFFRESEGYAGTELWRDASRQQVYLTIDRWSSRQAFERFRAMNRQEYEAIDRRCEALTAEERHLGDFELIP